MIANETRTPVEGPDTFIARLTLEVVNKVLAEIADLRARGTSEDEIADRLDERLRSHDEFTRGRIYSKSLGGPIEDDFPPSTVITESKPTDTTVMLAVTTIPDGVQRETLVQHRGEDYNVIEIDGNRVWLKKLLPLLPRPR